HGRLVLHLVVAGRPEAPPGRRIEPGGRSPRLAPDLRNQNAVHDDGRGREAVVGFPGTLPRDEVGAPEYAAGGQVRRDEMPSRAKDEGPPVRDGGRRDWTVEGAVQALMGLGHRYPPRLLPAGHGEGDGDVLAS